MSVDTAIDIPGGQSGVSSPSSSSSSALSSDSESLPPDVNHQSHSVSDTAPRMENLSSHAAGGTEQVHYDHQGVPGREQQQLLPASTSNHDTRPRERNVVIFGESGSGKSSVVNAIAQKPRAKTSGDAAGCTFSFQRYREEISGQNFVLFDTAGLNEGTEGTVPEADAEEELKYLLRKLADSDGIDLLVYCVRSTRARRVLIQNYNIFYSAICRKKVPIVIVITGLENETNMEGWWTTNEKELKNRGMHFDDHACVTTLPKRRGVPEVFDDRIAESREALRTLIVKNCSGWAVEDSSWRKRAFAEVRNMIIGSLGSETSPSILIICDPSQKEEVEIAPSIRGIVKLASIGGETYQVHCVPQPKSTSNVEGRLEGDLLIYYTRADGHSTAREKFRTFSKKYGGNIVPVIVVVKGLNDGKSADRWVEEHIMYDGVGHLYSTFIPVEDLEDDSVKQQSERELQGLIRQYCLIRNEGKGEGKYRRILKRLFW
ncbi:P-loop containing nucleoside triphosphate hydrolase protein [Suillus paluster]|uniref:P-loop containing nucleoside triphosphate hydrolase protein n=1 Tax=Suillus paluster TaxID=48578 RepID=UPI001B8711A4|nr:P-loop containing nucleoside triphosphate hydrolase protein [Suillus paluster]KAG1730251.1 P-loop containing nucleoside triphosphate hydrolase protein [Suillus paluster]